MKPSIIPFAFFLLSLSLFNFAIIITPFLALSGGSAANTLHAAFSPTCHQSLSRSLCITSGGGVADCPVSEGSPYSRANSIDSDGISYYKFPVCSRDMAIYLAMLAGLLIFPLFRDIKSEEWPSKWLLVAAAIPIAIDGGTQLVGLRESSNLLRILTGAIIGFALPFYILPMLNSVEVFAREKAAEWKKEKAKK